MYADQLTDAARGSRPGIGRRFDRRDVSTHDRRDEPGIDFLPADEDDVCRLAIASAASIMPTSPRVSTSRVLRQEDLLPRQPQVYYAIADC